MSPSAEMSSAAYCKVVFVCFYLNKVIFAVLDV